MHDFRWVLQVGIHDDNRVAARRVHPGADCDLMTEIARQFDQTKAGIGLGARIQENAACIRTSVVDEDGFGRAIELRQQRIQAPDQDR